MTADPYTVLDEWDALANARHVYLGLCPETPDCLDDRDPDCDGCRALDQLPRAKAAIRAVLDLHAEHVAPLVRVGRGEGCCMCTACGMVRALTDALTKENEHG